jgi:hypothetical protein
MKNGFQSLFGLVAVCLLFSPYGFGEDREQILKKAEAGNAVAQLELGWMYEKGEGAPQDDSEAVKWYGMAAEQGLASAQCNLGIFYMEGRGVQHDKPVALEWFHKAARQGHSLAHYNLGLAYLAGDGVPQDQAEAIRWIRKAADGKELEVQNDTEGFYKSIHSSPWALSRPGRIAEQGYPVAQNHLGSIYDLGTGVEQDFSEAFKWYRKAAQQGYAKAERNLANLYQTGHGIAQDSAEALKWFRRAAKHGDSQSQNYLGTIFAMGTGVPKDIVEALKWFILSADTGDEHEVQNRGYLVRFMSLEQIAESEQLARELMEVEAFTAL